LLSVLTIAASTYLAIGSLTLHTKEGLNGGNYGLGLEHHVGRNLVAAGYYRNSFDKLSHYLVAGRDLFIKPRYSLGLFAGVIDGYPSRRKGKVDIFGAGYLSTSWNSIGVNIILVPPAEKGGATAISFQFKVKLGGKDD